MELEKYYYELRRHDYYYMYSDDHSVFCEGSKERKRLSQIAELSSTHGRMWCDYMLYMEKKKDRFVLSDYVQDGDATNGKTKEV